MKKPKKKTINKINFRKVPDGLVPVYEQDKQALALIKNGDIIVGGFTRIRNPENHKRAFVFLHAVFDFQNRFHPWEFERFRKRMKLYAGAFNEDIVDGQVVIDIWSMEFGNMDEYMFKWLFSGFIDAALQHFCWGDDPQKSRQADLVLSFA